MSIVPISPIAISGPQLAGNPTATPKAAPGASESFGDALTNAIGAVNDSHLAADRLAVQAATGDLQAVHDYTIAATEAQLLTELTVQIRDRATQAFNDIMRMQV